MLLDRGVLSLVGGRSIFKAAPFPCFCWAYKIESGMVRWAKQNPVWDRAAPVQQEQGALLPQLQLLQGASRPQKRLRGTAGMLQLLSAGIDQNNALPCELSPTAGPSRRDTCGLGCLSPRGDTKVKRPSEMSRSETVFFFFRPVNPPLPYCR